MGGFPLSIPPLDSANKMKGDKSRLILAWTKVYACGT